MIFLEENLKMTFCGTDKETRRPHCSAQHWARPNLAATADSGRAMRSNPALVPRPGEEADEDTRRLYRLARAFYEMEERLPGLQEWVRGELERKGCVELDDKSARRRAEAQAVVDREWPAIEARMKALVLSERVPTWWSQLEEVLWKLE